MGVTSLGPIPEEITQFLDSNIESIDQLEILRILGEDAGKEWSVADLAQVVQAKPQAVATHLAALHSRGLVTRVGREAEPSWRHGAATQELGARVDRLLRLYSERPVTLIKLVYAQGGNPLRAFADAFRIRKEG
jgi:DNA-binding Lrp family transcriptional regulator